MSGTRFVLLLVVTASTSFAAQAESRRDALDALMLHAATADQAAAVEGRIEAQRMAALVPTARLLLNRTRRELDASRMREALDDADDAIELQPDQAVLWRERGLVHAAQGDADAAVTDLGGALARDPGDVASWSALSDVETERSQPRQALEAWEHVLQLDPGIADGAARLRHLHHRMVGDPT